MSAVLGRTMPWLAYPATIALGLSLHAGLAAAGGSLLASTYVPVIFAALVVTLLEIYLPNERRWKPDRSEVGQDVLYMLVVQILLPRLLAFSVVLIALDAADSRSTPLQDWWPHQLSVGLQVLIMVLVADFPRYWLHRVAHKVPWLWRLHAVHHAPQRLYWLNVGRFHPLEKALQFLLDTLPFILLGVTEDVIALYFVFYASNGFFQHSNIKLRFGLLNYVISSAELHRWHHSRLPAQSNSNFGNNVIIWDLLFGTRFLPADRVVGELGLNNRKYPVRFVDQMLAPFSGGITDRDVPLLEAGQWFRRCLLWLHMQWIRMTVWAALVEAAGDPQSAQNSVLRRIVRSGLATRFGKERKFPAIASYDDFIRRVPVQDYESLRPYIEAQDAGERAALIPAMPFMYAVTSGTTGEPKYIPVSRQTLRQYRLGQQLFALVLYRVCPQAFEGKAFAVASPAVEGCRSSGIPYGSVSGHLYARMPRLVRRNYVIPPAVYAIRDHTLKYKVMLRLALSEPDISYLAGANPSSFLRLLSILNESRHAFAESLEKGGMEALGGLPQELASPLAGYLKPCPERAEVLRRIDPETEISFDQVWPAIRLLTVWTGGSCGIALDALRKKLAVETRVVELGYLASELRVTVTLDQQTGAGLPMINQHFYEFIERRDWEVGGRQCLRLHQLREGAEYYVIVTTSSGLYRYFMNDIVRVAGRFHDTPTLRFMQKGQGVTNLTGEKIYEHQMLQAVTEVLSRNRVAPVFIMALADARLGAYRLYVEAVETCNAMAGDLSAAIDTGLCHLNIEYQSKRASGRLGMLLLSWLSPGCGDAYRQHCVGRGQREAQFKPVSLQDVVEFSFPIEEYVVSHD